MKKKQYIIPIFVPHLGAQMIAVFVIRNQLVDKKVIWQKEKQKNNRWLPKKYKRWRSRKLK